MDFIQNFPLFSIILCLLCAVVSYLLKPKYARAVTYTLLCVLTLLSASVLAYNIYTKTRFTYMMGHFPAPWGNEITAGIIEPFFAMLFSIVMLLCLLGGSFRIPHDIAPKKQHLYYVMNDMLIVSLIALMYTNDIFTGYVFIEICTVASCSILMIRHGTHTNLAAIRYMIFSLIGSGLFLIGVILLYAITGQLLFPQLKETVALIWQNHEYRLPLTGVIGLITIGLAIKSGLFPFHLWMSDTYSTATPASCGILSGIVSKGYILFLIRIIFYVFGESVFYGSHIQDIIFILGIGGIIFGSVSAIVTKQMTQMIAFSSAAQIGYIYLAISISPDAGIIAAFLQIVAHSLAKPLLFNTAAKMAPHTHDNILRTEFVGAALKHKFSALCFTVSAMSIVGIPCLIGFVPKLSIALASLEVDDKAMAALIALAVSTVLNVAYFLFTVLRLYLPVEHGIHENQDEPLPIPAEDQTANWSTTGGYAISCMIFSLLIIALGIFPSALIYLFELGLPMLG